MGDWTFDCERITLMTPRQSNIIFYTFLSFVATAIIIDKTAPDFFGDIAKSKEELLERAQLEAEETIERGGLEPLMKMEQREEFWRLSKY